MRIVRPEAVEPFENPHGVIARRLHETEHVQVVQTELHGGEDLS